MVALVSIMTLVSLFIGFTVTLAGIGAMINAMIIRELNLETLVLTAAVAGFGITIVVPTLIRMI